AERGARACGHVGPETEAVRLEKGVEFIEHNTGADTHGARLRRVDLEIVDLAIVSGEIDDEAFANRTAGETGAGATRCDGNVFLRRCTNDRACFLCTARKSHA